MHVDIEKLNTFGVFDESLFSTASHFWEMDEDVLVLVLVLSSDGISIDGKEEKI